MNKENCKTFLNKKSYNSLKIIFKKSDNIKIVKKGKGKKICANCPKNIKKTLNAINYNIQKVKK